MCSVANCKGCLMAEGQYLTHRHSLSQPSLLSPGFGESHVLVIFTTQFFTRPSTFLFLCFVATESHRCNLWLSIRFARIATHS